jgi:peptidoglycan/xylan/chitin deacetylase (PgdA/CDA1 family)
LTIQSVPVLMYHSIGIPNPNWVWKFLTVAYQIFEDHLRVLRAKGFNTIDLTQLYDYVGEEKPIPPNPIVLTFDDGYFDNWVYAYPLLKKYGFKGTVFVNPEFVDPTDEYRPNLEDVWAGKVKIEELISHGFLSWREMREMEKDGVMDIQSHGMTHTWYFTGPEIVDFRHPGDPYVWMNWNKDTDRKHKYLTENQEDLVELGTPVYQHEKSLAARRYFPDAALHENVIRYVKENGGKYFFKNKSWREQLFQVVEDHRKKSKSKDEYESEEDQRKRFEWELTKAKTILEATLKKQVQFFCWPGGGYNNTSLALSRDTYTSTTVASWDASVKKNVFGEDPSRIKRVGIPSLYHDKRGLPYYLKGVYLYLFLKEYKGSNCYGFLRQSLKAYYLFANRNTNS